MDDVAGRAWIVGTATEAVRAVIKTLHDRRIAGNLHWEPRRNHPTLQCELGGNVLLLLEAINGRAVARLNDGYHERRIELRTLALADQANLEKLLIDFVDELLAQRRARQPNQPMQVGVVGVQNGETGMVAGRGSRGGMPA